MTQSRKYAAQAICAALSGEPHLGSASCALGMLPMTSTMTRLIEAIRDAVIAAALLVIALTLLRLALALVP